MRIFYTVSYYGKNQYQKYYDLVLDALEKTGAEVYSPEKQNHLQLLPKRKQHALKNDPHRLHYEAIKYGIQQTDVSVIEVSFQDIQIGYETALAVQHKKPLLCLSIHEDFSQKILHPYFFGAKYSDVSIDNIIEEFIKKIQKKRFSERFNFFLSPTQLNYLKTSSNKRALTTSEYLRELIEKDSEK